MNQKINSMIMIVTILLAAFCYHYFKYKYPKQNNIVAIVENEKIKYNDFVEFAKKQDLELNAHNRNYLLDIMVTQKVILIYAEKSGIIKEKLEPEFKKEVEYLKKKVILDKYFDFESTQAARVSTREMKNYYDTHILYKIRAINYEKQYKNSRTNINLAYQKLDEKEEFVDVYHQLFPNEKNTKYGMVGVTDIEDMAPELKKNLSKLKKDGDYTPILETELFYSIYYRDSYPTFSECKEYIQKKVKSVKKQEYEDMLLKKISDSITFDYYTIRQMREDSLFVNSKINDATLAISNLTDSKLYRAEFLQRLSDLYLVNELSKLSEKQVLEYINAIFIQKVIYDYAIKNNFEENPLFKKQLTVELKQMEERHSGIIIKYMLDNVLTVEQPTEQEINEEYYTQSGKYRKSDLFKLQEIYVSKKETATKVQKLTESGMDFDTLVKTYSESSDAKITLGKTAYLNESDLGLEYKTFYKYKTNDITPMRQDLTGKYIVTKIVYRQAGAIPPIGAMRNEIVSRLVYERINSKLEELTDEYQIYTRKFYDRLVPAKPAKREKFLFF